MRIKVTGPAQAFDNATGKPITDPIRLAVLNGLRYDEDSCSNYLDQSLSRIGIEGGQVLLKYPGRESPLEVVTIYQTARKLNKQELTRLGQETVGQWSDGIGEGPFQFADKLGITVELMPSGTNVKPRLSQTDDGARISPPNGDGIVELLDNHRRTPVNESVIIEMVRKGVSLDAKNRFGKSILQLAISALLPDLVRELLRSDTFSQLSIAQHGDHLYTLACSAICRNPGAVEAQEQSEMDKSVQIAEQLLNAGFAVDTPNVDGITALMMASNRNNLSLVKFLLSKGANINAQDTKKNNHCSVLMYAKHPVILEFLLRHGADPNIKTAMGENALARHMIQRDNEDNRAITVLLKQALNM